MQNPMEGLGDKFFQLLSEAYESDPDLVELGVIVSDPPSSAEDLAASPPVMIVEHNLGVAHWAIAPLFKYARALFATRPQEVAVLERVTRALCLLTPDNKTPWNTRRRLVTQQLIENRERHLTTLVLSKHPKSGITWDHRRWALRAEFGLENTPAAEEIALCELTGERYPKNYYSWSHRKWLLDHYVSTDPAALRQFLESERTAAKKWISSHISQHCAFVYLRFVLRRLLLLVQQQQQRQQPHEEEKIVVDFEVEFDFVDRLLRLYTGHESAWCYRRMLWDLLLEFGSEAELPAALAARFRVDDFVSNDAMERFEDQQAFALSFQLCATLRALQRRQSAVVSLPKLEDICQALNKLRPDKADMWATLQAKCTRLLNH